MNKTLFKAIILRTNLRNTFLKNRSNENKSNYVKQRNYCVSLLRKTKRQYYSNLEKVCDNKTFWKIFKSMLSKKIKSNERINLIENDEIIKTEKENAKVLNAFFSNMVQNLDIQQYNGDDPICENMNDPLLKAIVRYRNHPSIVAMKKLCNSKSHFSFKNVQKEEILKELNNLNINKATQNTDIPPKMIKENSVIFGDSIFSNLNCCISTSSYPSLLKRPDITPVHKKDSKSEKKNYRTVSILSNIPKVYERIMFKEMSEFFESSFFSK